ncbi:OmpA family protein, partial [Xanthomonas euvesicatoria]
GYSAATPMPAAGTGVARARPDLMIGFHLKSDQLTPEGREAAQVFARSLQMPELRDRRFLIEGHTDLRGGRALNQSLSSRRAQAVADYLASLGVDRSRLQARGLGYSAPLPGHAVTDPANRRVEAELIR